MSGKAPWPLLSQLSGSRRFGKNHDKTFPAGIVFGCDNLSFSGEIKFARNHSRFIVRDLPQLVGRLMSSQH
ncbi:MAG: hypothetical protein ACO1TE_14700 [Prosthecobacter sp.]